VGWEGWGLFLRVGVYMCVYVCEIKMHVYIYIYVYTYSEFFGEVAIMPALPILSQMYIYKYIHTCIVVQTFRGR